jgi:hypothetical protein
MAQSDTKASQPVGALTFDDLTSLTETPVRRQATLEFAGVLTREDSDNIYVADPQGTWVIKRSDLVKIEDWKDHVVPGFMAGTGRAVRVAIKDGATIHEIRPWQVRRGDLGGSKACSIIDKIFTLGGAPLPVSDRSLIGESRMKQLERYFARRIGWSPDYDPAADLSRLPIRPSYSKTINIYDGYTDVDATF